MPTLAQVTYKTRTILKWGAILLGIFLIIFIAFRIFFFFFPKPEPPPTVAFGKLTFEFPKSAVSKNLNYSLDTVTGTLPNLSKQTRVYKMKDEEIDLLSLARATEKVEAAGFTESPTQLSESVYQWRDEDNLSRTLTMNIFSHNFNMLSSYLLNQSLILKSTDTNSAIATSQSFLQSLGLFPNDLDTTKTKTSLFSIKNFALTPATSLSNAQVLQVNFYQKNINGLPIYYSQAGVSPINLLVAEIGRETQVVEANFNYQKVSDIFATYPLKSADDVYSDLKRNKGYIASYFGEGDVLIKKVSLGYFIGDKKQGYLMPVIVFEGSGFFQAYVLAVKDEFVGN